MPWHSILFWLTGGLTASFFIAVLVGRCMALGRRPDLPAGDAGDASGAPPTEA